MKLTFSESRDWRLAWHISQHPSVVEGITNDEWGALDVDTRLWHMKLLVENPENHLLVVRDEADSVFGCFLLDKKSPGLFEVHTMLLPAVRGVHAIIIGRLAAHYMLRLDGVEKLVSQCPMNKRQILFYALHCGFKKVKTIVGGWVKDGQTYDLVIVEATL